MKDTCSELESTLLALLALHPGASGYDLHRVLNLSTGYLLSASFSQIYPALKKLHDAGLVTYEEEPIENRPAKKLYSLTDEGREALSRWLTEPMKESLDFRPFVLKMAFAPLMDDATVAEHLKRELAMRKQIEEQFAASEKHADFYSFLDTSAVDIEKIDYAWPMVNIGLHSLQCQWIAWLESWLETLSK